MALWQVILPTPEKTYTTPGAFLSWIPLPPSFSTTLSTRTKATSLILPCRIDELTGTAFSNGEPIDAFAEYHAFRGRKYELIVKHGHFAQLDIFNCFNSFYHHEVSSFVPERTSLTAGANFSQFLRELNAGVSVACFPQGLYPAKVVGNAYLSFIEKSRKLKAPGFARFLDDIILAAGSRSQIEDSVLELQYILDKHHLALNDSKTLVGEKGQRFHERKLDRIKRSLIKKREMAKREYDGADSEGADAHGLSEKEREHLTALVRVPNVAQEDIELALALLRDDQDATQLLVEPVFDNAPHLLRSFHRFLELSEDDKSCVWEALKSRIRAVRSFPEHDLFWYARILIDCFVFDQNVADLLIRIYEHSNASAVVQAAILEVPHLDHGLDDLKESAVRGEANLLVEAAAMVGLAKLDKAKRNHLFKYVARQGSHAAVLTGIACKMVA